MEIRLSPLLAKTILRINPFGRLIVVCKGYNDDYENYTELVWEDDKYLDFYDKDSYPELQLWLLCYF
jgi:hypothetical protein